jgi:hypothetical protein
MNGWPAVGWATLAVLAIVGAILSVVGTDVEGVRMGLRATARTSRGLHGRAWMPVSEARAIGSRADAAA